MNLSNLPLYFVGAIFAFIAYAVIVPVGPAPGAAPKASAAEIKSALASSQPVLLNFSATWCGPCRQVAPLVQELAVELRGRARVLKVDVDAERELAAQYNISGIPCFVVVKNGREVAREVGGISKMEMRRMLGL